MEKKEKLLPQLLAYAGKKKVLTYLSMVIAGISQLLALAPFLYIWAILRDVLPVITAALPIGCVPWLAPTRSWF